MWQGGPPDGRTVMWDLATFMSTGVALGILLNCSFGFSRSRVVPEVLHSPRYCPSCWRDHTEEQGYSAYEGPTSKGHVAVTDSAVNTLEYPKGALEKALESEDTTLSSDPLANHVAWSLLPGNSVPLLS